MLRNSSKSSQKNCWIDVGTRAILIRFNSINGANFAISGLLMIELGATGSISTSYEIQISKLSRYRAGVDSQKRAIIMICEAIVFVYCAFFISPLCARACLFRRGGI